jgi:hypothetical protein
MNNKGIKNLEVTSPAFQNDGNIPSEYTCDGRDVSPPLRINNIPDDAESLVLIMEDPDAPRGTFTHWLVWNIDPSVSIAEDSVPGMAGRNDFGDTAYGGPCPPSGTHRYFFRIFALNRKLTLPAGTDKKTLEQTMHPHIIAEGTLMGRYSSKK